jgi:polysaccharide biosynthesis protein PslH
MGLERPMTTVLSENQTLESILNVSKPCQKLRILFLTPFAPNLQAGHGGGRVIAQLIAHLAQRHAVGLCYLRSEKEPATDNALRDRCEAVEEVIIPEGRVSGIQRLSRRLRILGHLLEGKPLWAIDRFSSGYEQRLKIFLQSWQPDIIQLEFHIMGQYLPALASYPAPRILVEHEPGAESAREFMQSPFVRGRIMPFLDLFAWRRFERRIVQQVQTVVVFTDRDRSTVRKFIQKTPMVQIPLGTEIPEHAPSKAGNEPMSLLFVGNFKHPPNLDAADRLINHIFPKVISQFPETRLFIVGDQLPASLVRTTNQNIVLTGYVPDVTPYLDQAGLVIVPLRLGGGMRVKVLEALAAGKAVVASSRAVEGLELVNGEHLILAESDDQFVGAITDLIHHPEKRLTLARQAYAWASGHLGWGKVAGEYEKLYRCLLKC